MDGTPIYDIKPYLPYVDAKTDARGGFADHVKGYALEEEFLQKKQQRIPFSFLQITVICHTAHGKLPVCYTKPREVWTEDARKGCTYLAMENGEILGIFAFQTTPDAS